MTVGCAGEGVACHNPHHLRHHMPLQVAASAGKPAPVPTAVLKRFPHLAGCTPLLLPDNILRQVHLVPIAPALCARGVFCVPCRHTLLPMFSTTRCLLRFLS